MFTRMKASFHLNNNYTVITQWQLKWQLIKEARFWIWVRPMYSRWLCVCTMYKQYSSINPVKIVFPGRHRRFILTFIRIGTHLEGANRSIKTHGASRIGETCKHRHCNEFSRSLLEFAFTVVALACVTSLVPWLAISSCSRLSLLRMWRRAGVFVKLRCRRVKRQHKTNPKNQNNTSCHLRHNAPTTGSARFSKITCKLVNTALIGIWNSIGVCYICKHNQYLICQ